MDSTPRSRRRSLVPWLLACPPLLTAAVFGLPRFNQFHDTAGEKYVLSLLLALPLLGVVGILRYTRFTLPARLLLSAGYVIAGLALALLASIFIGCSWAGACF